MKLLACSNYLHDIISREKIILRREIGGYPEVNLYKSLKNVFLYNVWVHNVYIHSKATFSVEKCYFLKSIVFSALQYVLLFVKYNIIIFISIFIFLPLTPN